MRLDRWRPLRVASLLVAALPLAGLVVAALAASPPPVKNPHGDFKEDCSLCHDARGWKPAHISKGFDHSKYGFVLTGAHAATSCTSCHTSLDFKSAVTACASCHEDVHRGEFGSDCALCHTARSFLDRSGMTRAHALTRFPLTGAHAALDCDACHPPAAQGHLRFVGAEAQCSSCHESDYRLAKEPDHVASGFSRNCADCHSSLTWLSAHFDHDNTAFPLTGAHRGLPCASCHSDGVYRGKNTACVSCHQSDYNGTTNPNHAAAAFPVTCLTCHNTTAWVPAPGFDHDGLYFPIYSGTHAGRWTACSDCHQNNSSYAQFTCLTCHSQSATDPHHTGISGYVYSSQACYTCHPRGRT